jgi:hypothetical protein
MRKTRYFAVDGYGIRFFSVTANSENEARQCIREKLDRPRKRHWLELWKGCGERIEEDQR